MPTWPSSAGFEKPGTSVAAMVCVVSPMSSAARRGRSWDDDPLCPHCVEKDLPGPGTAQLCFVALPFAEAEADCVTQGGHLLSIPDQATQDWAAAEAFMVANSDWWIGLNDIASEDDFVWTDGTALGFTAWNEGEPNNAGEEDCANLPAWSAGLWNDLPCDSPRPYICKTP